ncbi:hypothetical protein DMY87_22935 [Rhizobium wuzhouense]|uniref:Uncharacterized protein n=1 Tax=Rhizobium wuzhouense TaxID=1986026 RepID=A0ABX5NKX4_9HYPH|nr:hypothetical protein DMY87_22935 [Rhizobium wuzhouense]
MGCDVQNLAVRPGLGNRPIRFRDACLYWLTRKMNLPMPEPVGRPRASWKGISLRPSRSSAWIFAILGPPIGGIATLWLAGAAPWTLPLLLATLAPAYVLGLGPALLVASLDTWLMRQGVKPAGRLLAAAFGGAACALALLAPLYAAGLVRGLYPLSLCLIAAGSSLLCLIVVLLVRRPSH